MDTQERRQQTGLEREPEEGKKGCSVPEKERRMTIYLRVS